MVAPSLAEALRSASEMVSVGNENTMTSKMVEPLSAIVPRGIKVFFDATSKTSGFRPDLTLRRGDADVAYIEVKLPTSLGDAFREYPQGGYQISSYRETGLPVFLTDGLRWYEVTDERAWRPDTFRERLKTPYLDLGSNDPDEWLEERLRVLLGVAANVRPNYSSSARSLGIASVIARINSAHNEYLDAAWRTAQEHLGLSENDEVLGEGKIGELIAFTILAIACSLPPLGEKSFVEEARAEWVARSSWASRLLPRSLAGCLRDFRQVDGETDGALLGVPGWVALRSIAADLVSGTQADWSKLSALWDEYLALAGKRSALGSWQTPQGVAKFQTQLVSEALQELGKTGLEDPDVTILDPACGTGVYLQEVADQIRREGGQPASLNAADTGYGRLIGCDISPAAVAASHIRASSLGLRPHLYMADTLLASGARGTSKAKGAQPALFDLDEHIELSSLLSAIRQDEVDMRAWSNRADDRDPVTVIIGNPPYSRSGLDEELYRSRGWFEEVFSEWKKGSGGRGSLQDPFVAFLAWAFRLLSQNHPLFSLKPSPGILCFITNRSWVDGKTFLPFRKWLRKTSTAIEIFDFGPGTRGAAGGTWSAQPFDIETGTAILLVKFAQKKGASVVYRKVHWEEDSVSASEEVIEVQGDQSWSATSSGPEIFTPELKASGVKTGADSVWVRTVGNRDFSLRQAYRAFDNRFIPATPPPKAARGTPVLEGQSPASADWRKEKLFTRHQELHRSGGWYLVGQSSSAKPGPALHATRYLPDNHFFNGRGGKVLRITPDLQAPKFFAKTQSRLELSPLEFWHVLLACAHHEDYWTEGTVLSVQLHTGAISPPLPKNPKSARSLALLGEELVDVWSLESISPTEFTGSPGKWKFQGHNEAELIELHGRKVLRKWRKARDHEWDSSTAEEYARSIAAVLRTRAISKEVSSLLK